MCPDGTFTFTQGASTLATCEHCSNGNSLECTAGNAAEAWNYWLDVNSVNNSTPNVYRCDITYGCLGFNYTGPTSQQCGLGYEENRMRSSCQHEYFLIGQVRSLQNAC